MKTAEEEGSAQKTERWPTPPTRSARPGRRLDKRQLPRCRAGLPLRSGGSAAAIDEVAYQRSTTGWQRTGGPGRAHPTGVFYAAQRAQAAARTRPGDLSRNPGPGAAPGRSGADGSRPRRRPPDRL
ncbi:hypothetical protein ACRAWD_06405 [Caulobacter segnis]